MMLNIVTTIKPGFLTTIQDEGRWGYQAFGVPVAGAMDRYAYRAANLLAGNKPDAAVIEMTMLGAAFRFDKSQLVAICGADMQAKLNGVEVANWSAFVVPSGGELTFEYALSGCRTYLAVRGGIDVPAVLGSRSTYTRARLGGLEGRALRQGDVLDIGRDVEAEAAPHALAAGFVPACPSSLSLRVLPGPQDDMFTAEAIATFYGSEYAITDEADRMGYRLEGPKVAHAGKADIVSDALPFGAVQIPAHGMPIIMMADRQTTGGYAKIGTVIGPDLARLAQAKPGDTVRFVKVTDSEAVAALREERQAYIRIRESLKEQPAAGAHGPIWRYTMRVSGNEYKVEIEEIRR